MSKLESKKTALTLEAWYLSNTRDIPWRKDPQPYQIWISEIMLQQTTMQVVRGYFKRFMTQWPNLDQLAAASQDEVNEVWAGLGYYSRARNILKCAKILKSQHHSVFPETYKELIKLPGIGPYTSRAISSICFNEAVGVVDGNVLRVYNRLLGEKREWWNKDFHNECQNFADQLCSKATPRNINQALMDLGATVCTPKKTLCLLCPLQSQCLSFEKGLQAELPLPKPKKQIEFWSYTVYQNPLKKPYLYTVSAKAIQSPVLKSSLLPYGQFKKLKGKPKQSRFVHSITNHRIYVSFAPSPKSDGPKPEKISLSRLRRLSPSSLIEKIWQEPLFHESI